MATTALALDNRQAGFSDAYRQFAREREIAMRERASRARSVATRKTGDRDAVGPVLQRAQDQFDLSAATVGQAAIDAATAAVEILKSSPDAFADDPGLMHNVHGVALKLLADLDGGTLHLEEARRAFEAARTEWAQQKNTGAAWLRATINLAAVIWQTGERSPAETRLQASQEAAEILDGVLPALPSSSPDRSRALDIQGSVLMTLGRTSEAIEAYEASLAALPHRHDPADRARTLDNLGTAYTAARLYEKAIEVYEQAIALQPPDHFPRAWGRTQNNLAEAWSKRAENELPKVEKELSEKALSKETPSEIRRYWAAAIGAYQAALTTKDPLSVADGWLVTVIDLANLLNSFGELELRILRVSGRWESENAPVDKFLEAIKLYETALPWAKELDRESIQQNLVFSHDAVKSCFDIVVSILAAYLPDNINIVTIMTDNISDVARKVRALLSSSKLPQTQWKAALTEVLSSLEAQTSDQSARPLAAVAPAGGLPLAVEWPKETYSEAHRKYGWDIIRFLEERWLLLIRAGVVTRKVLRTHDRSADAAVSNYIRNGRQLPDHLHISTKKEAVDQELARGVVNLKDANRLARAAQRRGLYKINKL